MTSPSIAAVEVDLFSSSGASLDSGVPAGLGTGDLDLIVALVRTQAQNSPITIPSGYTKIFEWGPSGTQTRIMSCWRHAASTPSSAPITLDNAVNISRAVAVRYRITGHDSTTPIDAVGAALVDDTANMKDDPASFDVPGITTQENDSLVFAVVALQSSYLLEIGAGNRFAVSSPWSIAGVARAITSASATSHNAGAVASRVMRTAGASGTCSFAVSANTTKDLVFPWTGGMFAIRSADPGGGGASPVRRRTRSLLMMM